MTPMDARTKTDTEAHAWKFTCVRACARAHTHTHTHTQHAQNKHKLQKHAQVQDMRTYKNTWCIPTRESQRECARAREALDLRFAEGVATLVHKVVCGLSISHDLRCRV